MALRRGVVCIALALAGCGEQGPAGPAGDRALIDPTLHPNVVSTYPPDNAMGPFRVFVPGNSAPHFIVQLNKLVERGDFSADWMRIEGFRQPVRLALVDGYPYSRNSFALLSLLRVSAYAGAPSRLCPYEVGRTYTVVVNTTLVDFTSQHLRTPYRFSFTPEPYFRVLEVSPRDSDREVLTNARVALWFNSPVGSATLSALRITPAPQGVWRVVGPDSSFVEFVHPEPFAFGTGYAVEVLGGAADAHGNVLQAPVVSTFGTRPFEIVQSWPGPSAEDVDVLPSIGASTNGGVDSASARQAFSIVPTVAGRFLQSAVSFSLQPAVELRTGTTYTVTISTALQAMDGTPLAAPYVFSFTTVPFRVQSTWPASGSEGVDRGSSITVQCTADVDSASVEPAFAIAPNVVGSFRRPPGRAFTYVPSDSLGASTTYTVTISTALRSSAGAQAVAAASFSFTTGVQ